MQSRADCSALLAAAFAVATRGRDAAPRSRANLSTTSTPRSETRPATTTINGDTGLWFVPTGEVLPAKKWSLSAYRVNFDRDQGFTDVSDWPVTFGVGAGDRAEIFGAWTLVRRIDRDVRPLFVSDAARLRAGWSTRRRSCGRAGRTISWAISGWARRST